MLQEIDEKNFVDLTTDWLREKYEKMNAELFDGKLGNCDFDIFTTGRGSEGRVLGWFSMTATGLFMSKATRRIYKKNTYPYSFDDKIYATRENFYDLTKPVIKLNGNYRWTEKAALSTLVHEMCHYYCNQDGWRPTQAHGYEFRSIASRVSMKSGKIFTVERIAKAEQMDEMELNSDMQAKKDKRMENKMKKIIPLIIWMNDGEIRLVNCTSERLLDDIVSLSAKRAQKMAIGDIELTKFLFDKGYRNAMTTYRYWTITGKDWLSELNRFNLQEIQILSARRALNEDIEKVLDEILNEEDEEIPINPNINLGIVNEDADKGFEEWKRTFNGYLNEMVNELQTEYLDNLNLKIRINPNYDFYGGRSKWWAAYEHRSGLIRQGIISIAVNYPLLYRKMCEKSIDKDEFNIEAQARITIGHEVGHGLVDYIRMKNPTTGMAKKVANCNGKKEEKVVEQFGEYLFPEATGVYNSVLNNALAELANEE